MSQLNRFDLEHCVMHARSRPDSRTILSKVLSFDEDLGIGEGGPIEIDDMKVAIWQIVQYDTAYYFTSVALKRQLEASKNRIVSVACLQLGNDMPGRPAYLIVGMM